mmetsp:Transcript_28846/g.67710  ORF Transcript_28846/g.67710 Transcript_28846/m.67710 type:complete len:85 (+) Transcript_28846:1397-1651(+)
MQCNGIHHSIRTTKETEIEPSARVGTMQFNAMQCDAMQCDDKHAAAPFPKQYGDKELSLVEKERIRRMRGCFCFEYNTNIECIG